MIRLGGPVFTGQDDLLFLPDRPGPGGEMAATVQHDPAAQRSGIPPTGPGGGAPEAFLEESLGGEESDSLTFSLVP